MQLSPAWGSARQPALLPGEPGPSADSFPPSGLLSSQPQHPSRAHTWGSHSPRLSAASPCGRSGGGKNLALAATPG